MTSPIRSKTKTTELPQAVAALRPDYSAARISRALSDVNHDSYTVLAFECHKALMCIKSQCDISSESYGYYSIGVKGYIEGRGSTHEERIFNAVLDWFSKREDSE